MHSSEKKGFPQILHSGSNVKPIEVASISPFSIFSANLVHESVKKFEDPKYFERLDQAVSKIGEL